MGRLRNLARWLGLGVLVIGALTLVTALLGARWERSEHRAFMDADLEGPGVVLALGSRSIHVVASGGGAPGVLLIGGLGDDYRTWSEVANRLSDSVRVVSYDRPGLGWSPPAEEEPGLDESVEDVAALLADSTLFAGPPIVVGHSLGGLIARQLALDHPELVAGLVLLDPTPPDGIPALMNLIGSVMYRGMSLLGASGFARWQLYRAYPDLTREEQLRWGHLNGSGARIRQANRELRAFQRSTPAAHSPGQLGSIPLTVVGAAKVSIPPGMSGWAERVSAAMRPIAEESTRGRFVTAETGHYVHREDPETTVREILRVLNETR